MQPDPDPPERSAQFTARRLLLTVAVSAAVLGAGSYLVRAYPNSGYDAGYDAVMSKGHNVIRDDVDAAGGASRAVCEALLDEVEQRPGEPNYDDDTFVEGCRAAVEAVYGKPVPLRTPTG